MRQLAQPGGQRAVFGKRLVSLASIGGSLLLLVLCGWFFYRRLDWRELATIWRHVNPGWLLLAVAVYWIQFVLITARFHWVLKWLSPGSSDRIPGLVVLRLVCASGFVTAVAPMGLFGDLARFVGLRVLGKFSASMAIRATLFDRMIGLQWMAVAGLATLPFQVTAGVDRRVVLVEFLVFAGVCAAIVGAVTASKLFHLLPWRHVARLGGLFAGYATLLIPGRCLIQFGLAALGLAFASTALFVITRASGLEVSFLLTVLFMPVLQLINSVPFLYMGWGGRELAFVATIGTAAGLSATQALAVSSIWGIVLMVSAAINGVFLIGRWHGAVLPLPDASRASPST